MLEGGLCGLGRKSYNTFIGKTSLELPSFVKFSLVTALSAESLFVDIADAFGTLQKNRYIVVTMQVEYTRITMHTFINRMHMVQRPNNAI